MPWWAIVYLVVVVLLAIAAAYDDLNKDNVYLFVVGNLCSGLFVVFFVLAYFVPVVANVMGILVFPMLVLGIAFEFYSIHIDLKESEELSQREKLAIMFTVNLLVVPGYVFGAMVGIRHANV